MSQNTGRFKSFCLIFQQGTIGFEAQIDKCLELSEYLYNKIKDREGYEMVFDGKVRSHLTLHSPQVQFILHNHPKVANISPCHPLLPQCIQRHYG